MTRKDYVLIAAIFAEVLIRESEIDRLNRVDGRQTTYADGVRLTIAALTDSLAKENDKFDRKRFLSACGITDTIPDGKLTALCDNSAKHAYDVEVSGGRIVRVEANTRTSAAARARKAGYTVMSVNLIG